LAAAFLAGAFFAGDTVLLSGGWTPVCRRHSEGRRVVVQTPQNGVAMTRSSDDEVSAAVSDALVGAPDERSAAVSMGLFGVTVAVISHTSTAVPIDSPPRSSDLRQRT
jgi:hypothetical protein